VFQGIALHSDPADKLTLISAIARSICECVDAFTHRRDTQAALRAELQQQQQEQEEQQQQQQQQQQRSRQQRDAQQSGDAAKADVDSALLADECVSDDDTARRQQSTDGVADCLAASRADGCAAKTADGDAGIGTQQQQQQQQQQRPPVPAQAQAKKKKGIVIGADDLLVLFVSLIVKGRVPSLHAQTQMMHDYTPEQDRFLMPGYYLATTQAAMELMLTHSPEAMQLQLAQNTG
jgi:DNA mismatch repair ATPase MutL